MKWEWDYVIFFFVAILYYFMLIPYVHFDAKSTESIH